LLKHSLRTADVAQNTRQPSSQRPFDARCFAAAFSLATLASTDATRIARLSNRR
jgi:hypothetical protein